MKIRSDTAFLFAQQGAKRWITRNRMPRPNAVLPLTFNSRPERTKENFAYSTDPRFLEMTEELVETCTREFPVDVLPSGFAGPTGVPGDFNSLLCVSGMGADPLPIPVFNNLKRVKGQGLAIDIQQRDKPWLVELIRLFFGAAVPANLHLRKGASSGFPYFTSDNQYKKMGTLKILKEIDNYLNITTSNSDSDLQTAFEEYHSVFCSSINERQQPNAITRSKDGKFSSKPRFYPTVEEARSGDYVERLIVDSTVKSGAGATLKNHFAMRRRPVFGYCALPNYAMTAIMGCHRAVYSERFAFTYKARGDADKADKISRFKYTVGSDVGTMDQLVPPWFFDLLYDELTKYWDDRLVLLLQRMMQSPYVVPPPWRDTPPDYDPVFGDSPLKTTSFSSRVGLPSGIFINPDIGKLWMTFVYAILYRDSGALTSPSELEAFLQGNNPNHALLDMSDDAAMLTNSSAVRDRLKDAVSIYAVLKPETPVVFLGSVFCERDGKKISVPNPVTYLVNALVRENSIDKIDPVRYSEGVIARMQQYSATPTFRDLNAVYDEAVRKHFHVSPLLIARQMAKRQSFSDFDAMVIANPHYLHYRVDPKDVSPDVLDSLVATIPHEDFYADIRHLFKMNVQ